MAIYHFSGTIISRSQGRSAVACAAYRCAERLIDERYNKTHDYTHKQDVAYTEILLPENAASFLRDREKLWNTVEASEKRKDAQLAREFNFALPRELTLEQNIALAREFVQQTFVSKGMIADLAIHNDKTPDGLQQPHAHVMLTLRQVTPDGFGQKVRDWNAKEHLLVWREAWADLVNQHLHLHGHDLKIDHRSLKEQGIELEPQHKIGASAAKERLVRLEDHQRIARENGEKILADPQIALSAITRQQSTFTHQDLARFVSRHTGDSEQFQQVYEKVKGHEQLVYLGKDDYNRERFTTKEMLAIETQMLTHATQLFERKKPLIHEVAKSKALSSRQLTDEQKIAFDHLTASGDLKCVVGYAGTGKSYLLGAAREAWERSGYRVLGATLSGIAAENLTGSSGIESRTLASRFYYWDKGEQFLSSKDILVIDEAGMIGSRQMARVLKEVEKHRAKVVLLGDPEQLQAIEAGGAFRAIIERTHYVELTNIQRQSKEWQKKATQELATGKTEQALARYHEHHNIHVFETQAAAMDGLISLWNDARISDPSKTQIMLVYTREEVRQVNEMARGWRHKQGELGQDHILSTVRGDRSLAEADRVYFLKNDRQIGVMNGTLGTIEAIRGQEIAIRLDQDDRQPEKAPRTVTIHLDQYNHIDHGYAATFHKGQGVTVDRSYVLASTYMDRHATYVGLSRHRESMDLFWSKEAFAHQGELVRTLSRERSKDISLDYSIAEKAFVEGRGIEKSQPLEKDLSRAGSPIENQTIEQDEASRYEQLLQQWEKECHRNQGQKKDNRQSDFRYLKEEFEAQNPKEAKAFEDRLRPRYERLALEAEKRIKSLEKEIATSLMPRRAREELEKYAVDLFKERSVMGYLKEHNPGLTRKIQGLVKAHERSLELDLGERSL
jgi:Ti-type conjugative transfer relaxase TraA